MDAFLNKDSGDRRDLFLNLLALKATVFAICLGFSKDEITAEELAQESYVKAYRSLETLKEPRAAAEWLYRIARNTCLDYLKKSRNRDSFLRWAENSPQNIKTPETGYIKNEQILQIKKAIRRLPIKLREVLVLREYGELSYQEIAGALRIKPGTVMSRLNRARSALLAVMREIEHE